MIYAQITSNVIINTVDLEDPTLIPLFSQGFDLFLSIGSLSPIPAIGWIYNPLTCTFFPPFTPSQSLVNTCIICGTQIIFQWNALNTQAGIYMAGQTISFLTYVGSLYQLLSLGYLNDANDAMTVMIADASSNKTNLDPFLTNEILEYFQAQVQNCINNLPFLE